MTRVTVKTPTISPSPTKEEHIRLRAIRKTRRQRTGGDVTKHAVIDPCGTIVLANREWLNDIPF